MNTEKPDMIQALKEHLANTSPEELKKSWEEIKAMNLGGPTVEEFLNPQSNISELFYEFDKRGVRAFVRYHTGSGSWKIECYRKMTVQETKEFQAKHDISDEGVWQMVREGHIMSYLTRQEAELKALELAQQICDQYNF